LRRVSWLGRVRDMEVSGRVESYARRVNRYVRALDLSAGYSDFGDGGESGERWVEDDILTRSVHAYIIEYFG